LSRDAETPARPSFSRAGSNLGGASAHNRRVILDALRTHGTLSRADLARSTLLTRQTTSNIIDDLEAAGLVQADPAVRLKRGQPAVPYRLVPSGAFAIGLHIDKRYLRAVAVDLLCRPLLKLGAELPDEGPYKGIPVAIDLVTRLQRELQRMHPEAAQRTVGLGVAMPGPFGVRRQVQHQGKLAQWHDFPLAHTLAKATGLMVRVLNDAAAATLAEKLNGVAHGIENFVYVFVAHGIGAGVVAGGELLEGRRGNLGEIGEMILGDDGRSLEAQASLASLAVHLGAPGGSAPETFELIERALSGNDPRIDGWIAEVAPRLRQAVQIIESAFDPDTIVFGGELPKTLLARLVPALEPLLPSVADYPDRPLPRLLIGEADRWAVALGAATEPISREFDPRLAAMLKAE
jgi:predicted NBD/HSP70 family sugar kinase